MVSPVCDELSYATASDPPWKRRLVRTIEDLSGRRRLLPVYRRWQRDEVGRDARMWGRALEMIDTKLSVEGPAGWNDTPIDGPLVVIANHPFGIADGIALLAIAEALGRPYRILLHSDLMRVPEVQPFALPVDFSSSHEAVATNLKTRAEARRLLKEGVSILVFPAGGVATAKTPFGRAEDLPWKPFVARLIEQSRARVLPVYFEGQNSALFHAVSRYSTTLRLSLLVCEFRRQIRGTIRAHVGPPVQFADLARDKDVALIEVLHRLVHCLAPGELDAAGSAAGGAIRARPPSEQRGSTSDDSRLDLEPRASCVSD